MIDSGELRMVFEAAQAVGDPLGVWQSAAIRLPAGEAALELATWRVDLPANPRTAQKALAANQRRIVTAALALPAAEARLGDFAGQLPQSGLEFALPDEARKSAEADLQRFLRRTQRSARQSYGLDDLVPQIKELIEAANRLAQNVRLSLASYALVESNLGGSLVGRTRVSWLGDFSSEWRPGLEQSQASLHRQAVAQALATRQSWVRIGLAVAASGASLAAALAGNPFALLGVFQFVRQVIGEFQGKEDSPLSR